MTVTLSYPLEGTSADAMSITFLGIQETTLVQSMAVTFEHTQENAYVDDSLLPWLLSIEKALGDLEKGVTSSNELNNILSNCILTFKDHPTYQNDTRFLKIWFLYLDGNEDYSNVFREIEERRICCGHSLLYEWHALFLEAKGKLLDALMVYDLGMSRNAGPVKRLKKARDLFIDRMSSIVNACTCQKVGAGKSLETKVGLVNPWSPSIIEDLLKKMKSQIFKYDGYHSSPKVYQGKNELSLSNALRNKVVSIGYMKYLIKGCAGQGGFAKVFKAYVNSNPDEVVALKIQKPAFAWEFYMYRQLDMRIPENERSSFGSAHRLHLYSDCSILVCDYLAHGTLQDVINSYVVVGGFMEEILCIYYTIEMLRMLETLHITGIIHGDFKPDNLLVRYARSDLTEGDFCDRSGPWRNQGVCLVDWGKGIDLNVFPCRTEFVSDCQTSCFRCIEMVENRPWKFQVDTYGLCVVVHMMLHNSYMKIEKKASSNGDNIYMPRSSFKRYWKVHLWENLFRKLLNSSTNTSEGHTEMLRDVRKSFEDYILSDPHLIRTLRQLLLKQRASLCSS